MVRGKIQKTDLELLDNLGIDLEEEETPALIAEEERVIAGFEEINRFIRDKGRLPCGTVNTGPQESARNIFERLMAVRLGRICFLSKYHSLLHDYDIYHLLDETDHIKNISIPDKLDDTELLSALGVTGIDDEGDTEPSSITNLRHVRSQAERQAAEEIADRKPCEDFREFRPVFERVSQELKAGIRQSRPFGKEAGIQKGDFFILKGMIVYVANIGETIKAPNGENDARLRLIYANVTESDLLRRSLQRALYKDETARRITSPSSGPLFESSAEPNDQKSGTIYVLRSLSTEPYIAQHREIIHKIGVTTGDVKQRIANAPHDPTYLLSKVEIMATYKLFNINPKKLEQIIHRILAPARLDLTLKDRFGENVAPREWFLVPLGITKQIVDAIRQNTFSGYTLYDPKKGELIIGKAE